MELTDWMIISILAFAGVLGLFLYDLDREIEVHQCTSGGVTTYFHDTPPHPILNMGNCEKIKMKKADYKSARRSLRGVTGAGSSGTLTHPHSTK